MLKRGKELSGRKLRTRLASKARRLARVTPVRQAKAEALRKAEEKARAEVEAALAKQQPSVIVEGVETAQAA